MSINKRKDSEGNWDIKNMHLESILYREGDEV